MGVSASAQVHLANGPGQALTPTRRPAAPLLGDLVDRVAIHYGALLAGETFVSGERLSWGFSGQTFGRDIFLTAPLNEGWDGQLVTLAHELFHAWQYERDQASGRDFSAAIAGAGPRPAAPRRQRLRAAGRGLHRQVAPALLQAAVQ